MGEVLAFSPRKSGAGKKTSMCREGHHKWVLDKAKQFDVKRGKLVTVFYCQRCGERKVTAH